MQNYDCKDLAFSSVFTRVGIKGSFYIMLFQTIYKRLKFYLDFD